MAADSRGYFGAYGGRFAPETLMGPLQELEAAFSRCRRDRKFREELDGLLRDYAGRPTPLTVAGRLSPRGARIVAVCDAYRAMTEDRPYRTALSEAEARSELERGAGGQFDGECVQALLGALERRDEAATIVALRPPTAD